MDDSRRGRYDFHGMRILARSALWIAGAIALLGLWVAVARPASLLLDRLHTVRIASQPITLLGVGEVNDGMLRINDLAMSTALPNYSPSPLTMKIHPARQFVVQHGADAIALGQVDDSSGGGHGLVVKPETDDQARFRIEHSMLSWPTPLEINFMSGHSTSWKRHLHYRLIWDKADGGRLEMFWRYEQYYYDRWASGFMTREGTTGLIRVDIRP